MPLPLFLWLWVLLLQVITLQLAHQALSSLRSSLSFHQLPPFMHNLLRVLSELYTLFIWTTEKQKYEGPVSLQTDTDAPIHSYKCSRQHRPHTELTVLILCTIFQAYNNKLLQLSLSLPLQLILKLHTVFTHKSVVLKVILHASLPKLK